MLRDSIDKRIKEIQQEQFNDEIWQHQQQEQQQLNENYDDLYLENIDKWNTEQVHYKQRIPTHEKIILNLYDKPFGTTVDLKNLDIDECQKLSPLLKKWHENTIKNKEIKEKLAVVLTVNDEEIFWPINNENVLKKIDDMFNGDYCFSADEIVQ